MMKTVLVVDDNAFARNFVKTILIQGKYNVIGEATNGDEAIALYRKMKPDFVTMDVVMPKKGGIEATRQILDKDKNARIIMVSAMAHEQLLMEAINAGARDYLVKPFEATDLLNVVEKMLQSGEEEESKELGGGDGASRASG